MNHLDLSRRSFLGDSMLGLGSVAVNGLLGRVAFGDRQLVPHFAPTAKRVVVIFTLGGMSQYELFDEKPLLRERHGDDLPKSLLETGQITTVTSRQGALPVVGAVAEFESRGECGMRMSKYLPHLGKHADKIALIRSMQTDSVVHERATVCFFTGTQLLDRPSMGSWLSYGLGSESKDLPEFVVLLSGIGDASAVNARMWGSGFLPGRYQGVQFRNAGDPVLYVKNPPGVDDEARSSIYHGLKELNEIEAETTGDPDVLTRIHSYEQAARMQLSVPELTDLSKEPEQVLERYGAKADEPSFARNCVLARRLLERGVRFVQLLDRGWDHHYGLPKIIERKCKETDKPTAALLEDLEQRGMLDDTVIVFAGEFGRTPYCEGKFSRKSYGRDHNNRVGALWLAGGGIRGGTELGLTDEWGWATVQDPVHVNDVQATILHCLGVDHTKLVYRFQGRDFRLTDVGGRVVDEILA
ncbi:MAG: DUF1501 domain-containing protein [Planctomycetota bacterium]|nr:DUF1501 domain-containing protein [Planctomycetota bacterium]